MSALKLDAGRSARLAADGFVIVDLIPAPVATALRAEVDDLHRRGAASADTASGYDGTSFRHPDPDLRREAMATVQNALVPHAGPLFADHVPLIAGYVVKPEGGPELEVHQDWTMAAETDCAVFNLWCPLVDVDEENGGLALVPGSHKVTGQISGPGIAGYWSDYAARLKSISKPLRLSAGQAVIYDNRVLHWASQNRSDAPRPVATMTWVPQSATPAIFLPEAADDGAQLDVVDMSDDGYVAHGAAQCIARAIARPRLFSLANPNRAIAWAEFEALTGRGTSPVTLSVSGLTKKYCRESPRSLRYAAADIAREFMPRRAPAPLRPGEFLALDDVSFELRPGEALAVLGPNGAGKSTLLKTIHGLLKPSRGEVRVRGSVGAMIELGTGFSPLLTGRENVLLGAALAGRTDAEAHRLLDDVVEFAELEEAIDAPFQSYSSGMKARLAYALATHLKPDILLVDEVLAVGDIHFQRKCVAHMRDYLAAGGCLLFVSHNTFQIQAVCNRAILLDHGRVTFEGDVVEAVNRMLEARHGQAKAAALPERDVPIAITSLTAEPVGTPSIQSETAMRVRLRYFARERLEVLWGFSIWTGDLWTCVTGSHDLKPRTLEPGSGELTCILPKLALLPGRYGLRGAIVSADTFHPLAMWGWENEPHFLNVRGVPDFLQNTHVAMNQLVTTDVEWE